MIAQVVARDPDADAAFSNVVTWHSARVTMIDLAGQDGRSTTEMLLQMHSTSPAMAEKYQRSRLQIPMAMVHDLCRKSRASWAPDQCPKLLHALDLAEAEPNQSEAGDEDSLESF